jgi:hypothetical protein
MNRSLIGLTTVAATLLGSAATAAPLSTGMTVLPDDGIQNVRMVCDEYGRCWQQPRRRTVIRESYGYMPQETYVRREGYYGRGYHDRGYYNQAPSVGIGVGPGGFGIGVGVGPSW